MIVKITKKELRRITSLRKMHHYKSDCLVWIAPNGLAYKCDKTGWQGTKEIVEHDKKIKEQMTSQINLL